MMQYTEGMKLKVALEVDRPLSQAAWVVCKCQRNVIGDDACGRPVMQVASELGGISVLSDIRPRGTLRKWHILANREYPSVPEESPAFPVVLFAPWPVIALNNMRCPNEEGTGCRRN